MAENPWTDMKVDIVQFQKNNAQVPLEYLDQFRGQQIAWHADGKHVVASAPTPEELDERLRELGIAFDEVVFAFVDDTDGRL